MRRLFALIIALAMLFTLGACNNNNGGNVTPVIPAESDAPSASPTASSEPIETFTPAVTVDIKSENKTADVNGNTIATVNINYPAFSFSGNPTEASQNLSLWAQSFYDELISYAGEIEDEARNAYMLSPEFFTPYSYNVNIDELFECDKAVMLIVNDSTFMGGAHAVNSTYTVCLDLKTGNSLELNDIAINLDALITAVEQNIIEQIQGSNIKNELFSDYADHIRDGIDNRFWYLSDEGLTIIYNEYILAPYSSGIFQFTVPYGSLSGIIKDEWILE